MMNREIKIEKEKVVECIYINQHGYGLTIKNYGPDSEYIYIEQGQKVFSVEKASVYLFAHSLVEILKGEAVK